MSSGRRFLNLIVDNNGAIPGAAARSSLRCVDLTRQRHKLFNATPPPALLPLDNKQAMGKIRLPTASFDVRPPSGHRIHCFPAAGDRRVFDVEAFVYRKPSPFVLTKSWDCELLPPPPPPPAYVGHSKISSYGVVKGGCEICISVDGVGTYCMDTASYAWSEVGKWTLPFQGKVEYVPELKLWFGFSANDRHFAAADISAMDSQVSQPQLRYSWNELDPPKGWEQIRDPQLVSLGSGRFCIARFFRTRSTAPNGGGEFGDDEFGDQKNVTVLTGVEFANIGYGIVCLGLVKHKSICHKSSGGEDTITAVL